MTQQRLTCAIVDDEPLAVELLRNYVEHTPFLELRATCASAVEALGTLRESPVDLLFLDIQMPELDGLELSRTIDGPTRVIFTTAFSQYAVDGYKVGAFDYLLKPISYASFLDAARRALEWHEAQNASAAKTADSFFVKSDYRLVRIASADVLYVEGLKDYVKIHLASQPRPVLALTAMHTVQACLSGAGFLRVHRSFIVNMERASAVERGQIVFGERRIPVSDSYKPDVQAYINQRLLQGRS